MVLRVPTALDMVDPVSHATKLELTSLSPRHGCVCWYDSHTKCGHVRSTHSAVHPLHKDQTLRFSSVCGWQVRGMKGTWNTV